MFGGRRVALSVLLAISVLPWARLARGQSQRTDTVVRIAAAPRYPGGGTLIQDLSIGSESQGINYIFARIALLYGSRDGSIWVVDHSGDVFAGENRARKFDSNGGFVTSASRAGDGPGEIRSAAGIVELPDGRIAIRDVQSNKIEVLTAAGKPSATWSFGDTRLAALVGGGGNALAIDVSGFIYLPTYIMKPFVPGVPTFSGEEQTILVRLRPDGTIMDSIRPPQLPNVELPDARIVVPGRATRSGGGGAVSRGTPPANAAPLVATSSYGVPYSPKSLWYWSPLGYMVTSVTSRYAIDLRIPRIAAGTGGASGSPAWRDGDPVVSIRRNVAPVPVSAAERRERREFIEGQINNRKGKVVAALGEIPSVMPAVRDITFGLDGRIWVQVPLPSERVDPAARAGRAGRDAGWKENYAFDVFEASGSYLGQVKIPPNISVRSIRGDVVYAAHSDELGVNTVRRFRVVWK